MAVDPEFQRQGFAHALMTFAHDHARERRYAAIHLDAFSRNTGAVALYERLGYRQAGSVQFGKGEFYCFEFAVDRAGPRY